MTPATMCSVPAIGSANCWRRGLHFAGRKNWTKAHRQWITTIQWEHAAERAVVEDYLLAIAQIESRLTELDARLAETAQTDPYRAPVAWLRCFRGIDTLTAMLILAELHDFRRFPNPRALMAYLGLVPSENSSGDRHRRGRITKTGNGLVRRVLIEASWHYQHRAQLLHRHPVMRAQIDRTQQADVRGHEQFPVNSFQLTVPVSNLGNCSACSSALEPQARNDQVCLRRGRVP